MATDDLYVLPQDVQLIPVTELDELTKNKFSYDENDFVITRRHSRTTSRVIDAGAASLLKEFRDPKSLVAGVLNYSVNNQLDPQETLDESYPFLVQLRKEGILILLSEQKTGGYQEIFHAGDLFREFEIVEKVQALTDTQVFRIKNKEGHYFALKILLTGGKEGQLAALFHNEIDILKHLDGKVTPALIEQGEYEGHFYMILEWCEGSPCYREAEKYRSLNNPENISALLEMAGQILAAYAHLHAQGVIHSDIHPGNVLISPGHKVKIIDFGLARVEGAPVKNFRGGMGFFYEPEYALTILSGVRQPLSSFEGEQYALGALLYLLVTGKQYLDFSFEKEELFRQIAHDKPIPFSKYDLDLDPEIEKTILRALSKQPAERYPSVKAFAEKWSRLIEPSDKKSGPAPANKPARLPIDFTEGLIRKFGWNGKFIEHGLQQGPTCSINYGAAGIAYLFYRLACLQENAGLLALADVWAHRAAAFVTTGETAFYAKEIDITPKTVGQSSLYHTAGGVHLVQALISHAMGDYYTLDRSLTSFLSESAQPCENPDLTLGRSGMLLGCTLLAENIQTDYSPLLAEELKKAGNQILNDIWTVLDMYPSLQQQNPIGYLGIAHGWAGFLYATVRWCQAVGQALPANFDARVDQLMDSGLTEKKQMRWPLTNSDRASWPGWCHGSAGYSFLWNSLHSMTGNEKYIAAAEMAANHSLTDSSHTNLNLCCGIAGQAYALLTLYRATKEISWLKKARKLTDTALQNIHSPSLKANSLYKGEVGIGILLAEIEQPEFARMPVFE